MSNPEIEQELREAGWVPRMMPVWISPDGRNQFVEINEAIAVKRLRDRDCERHRAAARSRRTQTLQR